MVADCGATVGAAPESVVSVSLEVIGTEGFAVLAAAADSRGRAVEVH